MWSQDGDLALSSGNADPEVLARLIIVILSQVRSNNAVWISYNHPFVRPWPPLKDNDLVELLPLCLMHVHHNNASFRSMSCGEMLLNERLFDDRKGIGISTVFPPILR